MVMRAFNVNLDMDYLDDHVCHVMSDAKHAFRLKNVRHARMSIHYHVDHVMMMRTFVSDA